MFTISKDFAFSASHVLDGLPDGHPCARMHGHNYVVRVTLSSDTVVGPGFVIDYRDLDGFKRFLDTRFDHRHLNDMLPCNPTSENFAQYLHGWLRGYIADIREDVSLSVSVSETPKSWATYG